MTQPRTEFGFTRTECACDQCVACCENLPAYLVPSDIEVIAAHLGYDDLVQFAMENLLASPGAIVRVRQELIRIPTLVPQRKRDQTCKFLDCDLKQKMASGGSKRWRASYHESTTYETHPKPGWKH